MSFDAGMSADEVLRAYNYNIKASLVTTAPVRFLFSVKLLLHVMFVNYSWGGAGKEEVKLTVQCASQRY